MTDESRPLEIGFVQMGPGPVLFSASDVAARVKAMAAEIDRDYEGESVQIVVIMNGAWVFAADLIRAMETNVLVTFLNASSYGLGTVSKGSVSVKGDTSFRLQRDKVLIVDDIVDTGRTAQTLIPLLSAAGAKTVRFAALLSKPSRRMLDVRIDYLGFEIPNKFVIGYGMDFCEEYRNLPDIHVLEEADTQDTASGLFLSYPQGV